MSKNNKHNEEEEVILTNEQPAEESPATEAPATEEEVLDEQGDLKRNWPRQQRKSAFSKINTFVRLLSSTTTANAHSRKRPRL